jgi:diketogulonate reductase-like aldo/keto reductase
METWRAFEELKIEGRSRSIGVSNFRVAELERLQRQADQQPTVNQIELHPYMQQAELRSWQVEHGVATEAWSPIAQGAALDDPTIATIAAHHERTPAQVVLRWHLQLGNVVIPKSVTPARIRENFEVFDFELSEDDMATIGRLDRGERIGPDPATFRAP